MTTIYMTACKIENAYLKQEWRIKKRRFYFLLQNLWKFEFDILSRSFEETAIEDAKLPLITDAFKGTVLEEGLILQTVVSGYARGGQPTTSHGRFQRNCA